MDKNDTFLKNYLKYFGISLLIIFITSLLVKSLFIVDNYISDYKNRQNYNYFEHNKENLKVIKDYIIKQNLLGYIYIDEEKYGKILINNFRNYNCFINSKCKYFNNSIITLIKNSKIDYLVSSKEGISINIKEEFNGNSDIYLFHSKGYFKGKQEWSSIGGDETHIIKNIFNDDWGLINSCYDCWGAWD